MANRFPHLSILDNRKYERRANRAGLGCLYGMAAIGELRQDVERAITRLREARMRTLALVQPLSQQQLDQAAGPDEWSVGEVLDHLARSEEMHRGNLEKLVRLKREGKRPWLNLGQEELDVNFAFVPNWLAPALDLPFSMISGWMTQPVREFLTSHRVLPFRAPTRARPQWGLPADELRTRLLASMEQLAAVYTENADLDFRELVCRHALLGSMNMLELLSFIAGHEARHQRQIREILGSP